VARLTVLFSTFNGEATLPRMLDALGALRAPSGDWKVVAVDNGSTDASLQILKEAEDRLPITVVTEPRRGKSCGLNAGLSHIEGDLVVLTDDDVIPDPDWLVTFSRIADERPEYDVFGGAIYPVWPQEPPGWILRCAPKGHFAWTDFPDGPAKPTQIWGPNMAVRTDVLNGHRFADGIGPDGAHRYATGLETELVLRLAREGRQCWHAREVVVGHIIESKQLTPAWLLQRAYNHGLGTIRLFGDHYSQPSRPLLGLPRRLFRQLLLRRRARLAVSYLFGDFEARFAARRDLSEAQGELDEWRAQRLARAPIHSGD
jgi:glycosyltransferase involved in cell wall biosynthesis